MDPLYIRKNTQKSKFLLSQAFKWKKKYVFVIPEMHSKTFVIDLKKLPGHFKQGIAGQLHVSFYINALFQLYRTISGNWSTGTVMGYLPKWLFLIGSVREAKFLYEALILRLRGKGNVNIVSIAKLTENHLYCTLNSTSNLY